MYMLSLQRSLLKNPTDVDVELFFHDDLNEIVDDWIKQVSEIDNPDALRKAVVEKDFRFTAYIRGNVKIKVRVSEVEAGDYVIL